MRWWKKKVSLDTRKDPIDHIKAALDDQNTIIQNITMEFQNPANAECPVTSEGWGIDLLTALWKKAKYSNAGRATLTLSDSRTAELWTCEIIMTAPDFYKGWRRATSTIGRWFLKL